MIPDTIKKDELRDSFLIKKGYSILRIKEQDYLTDKEVILKKCITFINENYE
jgi:very-short-patch-repair endonuclease